MITLALKQVLRHRMRSGLTIAGVAAGMFLFTAVETMQYSLSRATDETAGEATLVVFRENRFCPSTSRLPEHYLDTIDRMPGVAAVIPIQILVNHCGATLDVITYRGVPRDLLTGYNPEIELLEGTIQDWHARDDAALVGEHFARRRGLRPGDSFEGAGITIHVAGIIRSPMAQDNNVAYVTLPFLQQASRTGLGVVTQFNVRTEPGADPGEVAKAIDETFAADSQPTYTRPESAFFAETAGEMIQLIGFTRWLGIGAVVAVLGLVANALLLIVRGRVRETAVLQTLGFSRARVFQLVVTEGLLLGVIGGALGILAAAGFFHWQALTFGNEGLTLAITISPTVVTQGLIAALTLALLAALYPAWIACRRPIVAALRSGA